MTPWTVAPQSPLSMGFPRQEYWSGLPIPSPGDLPDSGIELVSPALQADSLLSEPLIQSAMFGHWVISVYFLSIVNNASRNTLYIHIPMLFFFLGKPHSIWDLSSLIRD